ncbi:helix-turn-helix domain-containing protein [Actinokineospora inagensis]|uniref:helix-turn-helix domain-containing protein n=1 Tax=Actinokineospora inagensis TaxID=103730 RepID=UPI0003F99AD8|nr:helix-turn-helix transcriptional regulator [Actinokineospora inagensis]
MTSRIPSLRTWLLGRRLRSLIDSTGIPHRDIAKQLNWHRSDLSRFLNGQRGIPNPELGLLLYTCGVDTRAQRQHYLDLNTDARRDEWWHDSNESPLYSLTLDELESQSDAITAFTPATLPTQLQTDEYAAMLGTTPRRHTLDSDLPTNWHFLISRQSLTPAALPPQVIQEQARHLFWESTRANVTIQVIPHTVLTHDIPFRLITVTDHGPVIHLDLTGAALFLEALPTINRYTKTATQLTDSCLTPDRSRDLLAALADPVVTG